MSRKLIEQNRKIKFIYKCNNTLSIINLHFIRFRTILWQITRTSNPWLKPRVNLIAKFNQPSHTSGQLCWRIWTLLKSKPYQNPMNTINKAQKNAFSLDNLYSLLCFKSEIFGPFTIWSSPVSSYWPFLYSMTISLKKAKYLIWLHFSIFSKEPRLWS